MTEWQASPQEINGKRAICHVANHSDLQLCGRYGIIWEIAPNSFKALIDNHKVYNELAFSFRTFYRAIKGEELFLYFGPDRFNEVYKAIKVPRRQTAQVQLTKRFQNPL